jgi:hypothetical protein
VCLLSVTRQTKEPSRSDAGTLITCRASRNLSRSSRVAAMRTYLKEPYARGRGVSDLSRRRRDLSPLRCPRCRIIMDEAVRVAPVAGEPGVIAFECPNCKYVTSVLEESQKAR